MTTRLTVAKISTVVPAHNEEELLEACLISIQAAAKYSPLPVEVVVVADECVDRTAKMAARYGQVIEVAHRNVGAARQSGFRATTRPNDAWMATTDADSTVPIDWFAHQVARAELGVELLAGTVHVTNWETYSKQLQHDYEHRYQMAHPTTRIHGCNLGFLGRRYLSVGGFAPLAVREDVDLVTRFVRAGAYVVWSDESPVVTSARRTSRAAGGFAAHLTGLELAQ